MASEIQINANRINALNSTGPRSETGKSTVSQNALKSGLFSKSAYVQPCEQPRYNAIHEALYADLAPQGPFEENLVTEIIRASWRLERCAEVEAGFMNSTPKSDPMSNDNYSHRQNNVDRARAQSHRIIMRTVAELRRLQTERQARQILERELAADLDSPITGVASSTHLIKARHQAKSKLTKQTQSSGPSNRRSTPQRPNEANFPTFF